MKDRMTQETEQPARQLDLVAEPSLILGSTPNSQILESLRK
jgi:hypothetical protein